MGDKTIVTNPASSESGNPKGAGENLNEKEIENRIRENLRAEYDRKMSERVEAIEAEKAELQARIETLTPKEERRLVDLNAQVHEIETNPELAGYNEKIMRETAKVSTQSEWNASKLIMEDFIERKAEMEKISPKKLREELNDLFHDSSTGAIKYPTLLPHERVRLVYSERMSKKEIAVISEENKSLRAERDGFSEGIGHIPRNTKTSEELRLSHISGDFNAGMELAKNLDSRQKEYDSQAK